MSSGNEYVLGRDYLSSLRLNAQHLIWKEQLGYVLHPRIPITDAMKVADIGTGTGIWLVELSRILPPSAQLHGFDIDTSQSPPQEWLSPNIAHSTWDAFSEVPDDMFEQYDVVHIAIFMLLISKNDPSPLLKNLIKMLKPGGYIQWDELDWGSRRTMAIHPSLSQGHLRALLDYVSSWENALGPKTWIGELSDFFTGEGLNQVTLDRYEMSPEYRRYDNDKSLTAYEEFSHTVLDPRGKGEGEYLRGLIGRASKECQKGVCMTADMIVVVGQK